MAAGFGGRSFRASTWTNDGRADRTRPSFRAPCDTDQLKAPQRLCFCGTAPMFEFLTTAATMVIGLAVSPAAAAEFSGYGLFQVCSSVTRIYIRVGALRCRPHVARVCLSAAL